ncbi:MAG TPA: ATP-grasp domain-containing protein [Ktedonobacteraceae bacterium]
MHICLIMDNPETPQHPVIAVALQALSARHTVRLLDILNLSGAEASRLEAGNQPADLYLLKSHAPQALELAQTLELAGRQVVNSWSSSLACQDRTLMTAQMQEALLPWPATRAFATLAEAVDDPALSAPSAWPLIIKSRFSQRGDLVDKLHNKEQLQALLAQWSQEPIVFQEFIAGDGWDIKIWVIDQHVFAARRRTPLEEGASKEDFPISAAELPTAWRELALAIGRAFKMPLYGVDLLITQKGPLIVDVNAFPGFRGVPGASEALVELIERLLQAEKSA